MTSSSQLITQPLSKYKALKQIYAWWKWCRLSTSSLNSRWNLENMAWQTSFSFYVSNLIHFWVATKQIILTCAFHLCKNVVVFCLAWTATSIWACITIAYAYLLNLPEEARLDAKQRIQRVQFKCSCQNIWLHHSANHKNKDAITSGESLGLAEDSV